MKTGFFRVILFFVVVFILTALFSPYIYNIADFKFYRIVSRLVMLQVIFGGIFILYRNKGGINFDYRRFLESSWLKWEKGVSWKLLLFGFLCSFLLLILWALFEIHIGTRILKWNIKSKFPLQLLEYTLCAAIVSILEETFFRGIIFKKLLKISVFGAFVWTNLFYAAIHFLKPLHFVVERPANFFDTIRLYGNIFTTYLHPSLFLPGFIGLFIFGIFLSFCCYYSGSLYYSIGIHAGAVFFLKVDNFFLNIHDGINYFIHGDKNVYTGIYGWILLFIMWGVTAAGFKIFGITGKMEKTV